MTNEAHVSGNPLEEIKARIEEDTQREVIHIAVVGSRLHNLANEYSDYDIKAYIVPTANDLLTGYAMNRVFKYPDLNAEGDIKDIRLLIALLDKQGPNYLDCLNTYASMTDEDFQFLLNYRDFWYQYNPRRCFSSSLGWFNRYKSIIGKKDAEQDYGEICKLVANVLLIQYIGEHLTEYGAYPVSYDSDYIRLCREFKNGGYTYTEMMSVLESVEENLLSLKKNYWDVFADKSVPREKLEEKDRFSELVYRAIWNKVKSHQF